MTQKRPRQIDSDYLKWLRLQPCACGCLRGPPSQAAHLRSASLHYDKPLTGMQRKPDDFWATPLNWKCHREQHAFGSEISWWAAHGVADPWALALLYYASYGGDKPAPKLRPRKKTIKHWRSRPIQSRPFAKVHRPLRRSL